MTVEIMKLLVVVASTYHLKVLKTKDKAVVLYNDDLKEFFV